MLELVADRIVERRNRMHAIGHRLDPPLVEREPVAERRGEAGGALVGEVGRVRLEHLAPPLPQQLGQARKRRMLRLARRARQLECRAPRARANVGD